MKINSLMTKHKKKRMPFVARPLNTWVTAQLWCVNLQLLTGQPVEIALAAKTTFVALAWRGPEVLLLQSIKPFRLLRQLMLIFVGVLYRYRALSRLGY